MDHGGLSAPQVVARVTPLFWVVLGTALIVGVGEIVLLAIAGRFSSVRGRDRGAAPPQGLRVRLAVAAAAGPLMLAGVVIASVHLGHARLLAGLAADEPRQNVASIVAGLEGFMNAKSWGLMLLIPIVALGGTAAALHAAAATKWPPRAVLLISSLFLLAGLSPFLIGAFLYSAQLIKLLAGVAGVDPVLKRVMILRGIEETREVLDRGAAIGAVGIGVALVVGIAFVVVLHKRGLVRGGGWWAPGLCLLAAAGLWLGAQPLRAENDTPWPASPGAALTINRVTTPNIDGPDPLRPAEVVTVGNDLLLGDGAPLSEQELRNMLVVMRNNYRLLHPGALPDEHLLIVCAPDTRPERLIEVLSLAKETGYTRPAFAFGHEYAIDRPTMGSVRRWHWTAAQALIPGVGPETPMPIMALAVRDYPSCAGLAGAVAGARRAGKIASLSF
ncbi:MAG TPA: hypothetical protein VMT03_13325 [Polyangia bacterium]|nr:hypothetical protein [Polyangia bacterium]